MRVEWLRTALKNLDDEAAYIAMENPKAAADFVQAILASVDRQAEKVACPGLVNGCCPTGRI
jgi:toxin ParE1/3/4